MVRATRTKVTKPRAKIKKKFGAITDDDAKEMISLCLVGLHCASGRLNISQSKFDRQSCDLTLEYENLSPGVNDWSISYLNIQAKATSSPRYARGSTDLVFDLSVKNYNDLRRKQQHRAILAIAVLDGQVDACILYGADVQVKAKIYYKELLGSPPTKNKKRIQVKIPVANEFTHTVANRMLLEVSTKKWVA